MNALHKVAWIKLIVSLAAVLLAIVLYPWIGDRAAGAFGILGLLGICPLLLIDRKNKVISDERDRQIDCGSSSFGGAIAWTILYLSVLAVALWHSWSDQDIPARYALALVYINFPIYIGVQGAYSLVCYRSKQSAA